MRQSIAVEFQPGVVFEHRPLRFAEVADPLEKGAEVRGHLPIRDFLVVVDFQYGAVFRRSRRERPAEDVRLLLGVLPLAIHTGATRLPHGIGRPVAE